MFEDFLRMGLGSIFGSKSPSVGNTTVTSSGANHAINNDDQNGLAGSFGTAIKDGFIAGMSERLAALLSGHSQPGDFKGQGEDFDKYMNAAFPNTKAYERLGQSGAAGLSGGNPAVANSQQNRMFVQQDRMQQRQLDGAFSIAELQAKTNVETAHIQSGNITPGEGTYMDSKSRSMIQGISESQSRIYLNWSMQLVNREHVKLSKEEQILAQTQVKHLRQLTLNEKSQGKILGFHAAVAEWSIKQAEDWSKAGLSKEQFHSHFSSIASSLKTAFPDVSDQDVAKLLSSLLFVPALIAAGLTGKALYGMVIKKAISGTGNLLGKAKGVVTGSFDGVKKFTSNLLGQSYAFWNNKK